MYIYSNHNLNKIYYSGSSYVVWTLANIAWWQNLDIYAWIYVFLFKLRVVGGPLLWEALGHGLLGLGLKRALPLALLIVNSTDKKCKWHLLSVLSELTIIVNQWQEMSYDKNCQYLSIIEKHWQLLSKITIIGIFLCDKKCHFLYIIWQF